jgi:hypothetical protein
MQIRAVLEIFGNIDALLGKKVASFMQSGKGSCCRDATAQQFESGIEVSQCPASLKRTKELSQAGSGIVAFDDYFKMPISYCKVFHSDTVLAFSFQDCPDIFEQ